VIPLANNLPGVVLQKKDGFICLQYYIKRPFFIAIIHDLCETAKPFYKMPIKIKPGKEKSF